MPVPERIVTEAEVEAARDAKTIGGVRVSKRSSARSNGRTARSSKWAAPLRASDCATRARRSSRRSARSGKSRRNMMRGQLLLEQMKAGRRGAGEQPRPDARARHREPVRGFDAASLRERPAHAELGTEGVVVAGAVRPTERISVGTREQLSTLYRLALAEYLSTTVVLDDQLVQSDGTRMDWFRALLAEKARSFQIVVFTCRPGDYLDC